MDVRRPLEAVPLAYSLPLIDNPPPRTSPYRSSTKRPRSPTAMLSPAKRRILRQEGYLPSPSSNPVSSAGRDTSLKKDNSPRGRLHPRTFPATDDQAVRYGDVSSLTDAVAGRTRLRVSSTSRAVPPIVQPAFSKPSSKDPFVVPEYPAAHQRAALPLMVPREMPPRPDPQSPHYPGFDIYYDTHIEVPSTSSRYRPDLDFEGDEDCPKENTPLKKLAKRFAAVSVTGGSSRVGGDTGSSKAKTQSSMPFHKSPFPDPATLLAKRSSCTKASTCSNFTPGRTLDNAGSRLARKQAMIDEADHACSGDEEL